MISKPEKRLRRKISGYASSCFRPQNTKMKVISKFNEMKDIHLVKPGISLRTPTGPAIPRFGRKDGGAFSPLKSCGRNGGEAI
jgi:hypothetical protein